MTRGRCRGFTLIELLVTMLIAGILLSALLATYQRGLFYWRVQAETLETRDHLRVGLDRVAREVRAAVKIVDGTASGGDSITIETGGSQQVRYYYDPQGRQLLRSVAGGANSVADNIEDFVVICRPDGLVTLRLTGGPAGGEIMSLETAVWVRTTGG